MPTPALIVTADRMPEADQVLALYAANRWSSAEKPAALMAALAASHSLVTAWEGARLVGLANALSDGHLVVYYPHLLVAPDRQGRGIGAAIMATMQARYAGMHQQVLIADGMATGFYRRCGFVRAGKTEPMWIYAGADH